MLAFPAGRPQYQKACQPYTFLLGRRLGSGGAVLLESSIRHTHMHNHTKTYGECFGPT